jgi:phosphoribosylformylglycinamidine synthase II
MVNPVVYKSLGLTDKEYSRIEKLLGREPSPTELAMFSVEWSEHCGYGRSKPLLKKFPREGRYPVLVGEDAGGFVVDDLAVIFKMESHNHPSQVEPHEGAATGVGGIIRDIFTSGARPIASLNSLRFGPPDDPFNRYIFNGVVGGISSYGNCIGVPTVAGEIYFEDAYAGNCLVNAMSIGVCKKDKVARARASGVGNIIIYAGSRTGRDGIGGCSVLASAEFKCAEEEKRPTVQIGDPFTEKCLIEATLEALDTGYVVGIKDMGAAGLTCSTSEMAYAGDVGMEVDLTLVPLREEGMEPYEIMMSESQERQLVCVEKGREEEIIAIFKKWGLEAVNIGKVTEEKVLRIWYKGEKVVEIKSGDLAEAPMYDLPVKEPDYIKTLRKLDLSKVPQPKNLNKILLELLSSPNIANKSMVYETYDHMVQTNTVVLPGSDAAVIRLKGHKKALAATTDCNGRYCYVNPHLGAMIAVAEAARNLVCSGADPAALTDCLNFGNPDKPERYWEFKNCVEGIIFACKKFNIPVVSGNVSFYNESPKGPIYPTPTIGMIGVLKDLKHATSAPFKKTGDVIILLGENLEELGVSEYMKVIHGQVKGDAPSLFLEREAAVHAVCLKSIQKRLISSAHDCSEGGLAVALAECCICGDKMIGAQVTLNDKFRPDALLFGETQSRIIVSCSPKNKMKILNIAKKHNIPYQVLGKVGGKNLKISSHINSPVEKLYDAWKHALPRLMSGK